MSAEASTKAEAFAEFASSRGWTVQARKITDRDYEDKHYRQAGWTLRT
jgi:hypothetical protein